MQAEDIIQQKEWSQLNENEKQLLAELAASEAEFNLLKKMLLVSQEEVLEVPVLNENVKHNLHAELRRLKHRPARIWYYAAASIIIIAIASLFFLRKDSNKENIAKENLPNSTEQIDSGLVKKSNPANDTSRQNDKNLVTPAIKIKDSTLNINDNDINDRNQYSKMIATIESNSQLLELVTEVY